MEAHQHRIDSIYKIKHAEELLSITGETCYRNIPKYEKKTVEYALRKFIKRVLNSTKKEHFSVKSYHAFLDEQPHNMDEAYKMYPESTYSPQERLYLYLRKSVAEEKEIESKTLNVLIREGYHSKEELIEAFNKLLKNKMELKLQLTYSQLIFNNLIKIINCVSSLNEEDAQHFFEVRDLYLQALHMNKYKDKI